MPDVYDYFRACVFEKFSRNKQLGPNFMDENELVGFFHSEIRRIMKDFNIDEELPLESYAWRLFEELRGANLIAQFDDPLAGSYFWAKLPEVAEYMSVQLKDNDIYNRSQLLRDDRLYEAVFSKVGDGEIIVEDDEVTRFVSATEQSSIYKNVLTESERTEFRAFLPQIKAEIEKSELSQEDRSDALALLDAINSLSEAPHPLWGIIGAIMASPILANITSLTALAIAILRP